MFSHAKSYFLFLTAIFAVKMVKYDVLLDDYTILKAKLSSVDGIFSGV